MQPSRVDILISTNLTHSLTEGFKLMIFIRCNCSDGCVSRNRIFTHSLKLTEGSMLFSRPRQSQGLLYEQLCDSLIKSVSLFLPQLYGAATPKRLEIALSVIK